MYETKFCLQNISSVVDNMTTPATATHVRLNKLCVNLCFTSTGLHHFIELLKMFVKFTESKATCHLKTCTVVPTGIRAGLRKTFFFQKPPTHLFCFF